MNLSDYSSRLLHIDAEVRAELNPAHIVIAHYFIFLKHNVYNSCDELFEVLVLNEASPVTLIYERLGNSTPEWRIKVGIICPLKIISIEHGNYNFENSKLEFYCDSVGLFYNLYIQLSKMLAADEHHDYFLLFHNSGILQDNKLNPDAICTGQFSTVYVKFLGGQDEMPEIFPCRFCDIVQCQKQQLEKCECCLYYGDKINTCPYCNSYLEVDSFIYCLHCILMRPELEDLARCETCCKWFWGNDIKSAAEHKGCERMDRAKIIEYLKEDPVKKELINMWGA